MTTQDSIFSSSEGNNWFGRNREALASFEPMRDLPVRLVETYGVTPASVVEIGAASGARVAFLRERFGCAAAAIDPSEDAIHDGRQRFPEVEFHRGLAHDVPLRGTYDLVIANFVFHWIDRSTLFRSVAEVDRLVGDGGFLIIGDFLPSASERVPYHHLTDSQLYTYKHDYAKMFTSSAYYRVVAMLTAEHGSNRLVPDADAQSRAGYWLLHKQSQFADGVRPRDSR